MEDMDYDHVNGQEVPADADADVFASAEAPEEEDQLAVARKLAVERRERAEERDAEEREARTERRQAAERDLAQFRSTLEDQREKRREANREHDTQLADEIEEAKRRKEPWERVNNLIDVGKDSGTQTKDISVMRKTVIRMKQNPVINYSADNDAEASS